MEYILYYRIAICESNARSNVTVSAKNFLNQKVAHLVLREKPILSIEVAMVLLCWTVATLDSQCNYRALNY